MVRKIRMADIAKELGVSTVTVSKALGNQRGVSDELREKIKTVAEEMGYELPVSYKNRDRKGYNIGVLVATTYIEKYATFYWEFYQLLSSAAAKINSFVMLEILSLEAEKELQDILLIREGKIDGLIILGKINTEYLNHIKENCQIPTVYLDFYDNKVEEDCVISNSFYGAYKMTNYLFNMGHKEIAYVGTLLTTDSITDRYLGYQKSMLEHGNIVKQEWLIKDREDVREMYDKISLPEQLPTAFFCNSDLTASKVIKALQERGMRVPEDVSVAGYDDYLYPGVCDIPLTTYAVDMGQMVEEGIHILVKKIEGEPYRSGIHVIEGKLVERASVLRR